MSSNDPNDTPMLRDAFAIANSWGWFDPPDSILSLAELSLRAQTGNGLALICEMKIMSEQDLAEKLERCPTNTSPFYWLQHHEPEIASEIERIMTLRSGYPYYSDLSVMEMHPWLHAEAVLRRADEIDGVLMAIDGEVPVIVFSAYEGLLRFRSLGWDDCQNDPMLEAAGGEVKLAVSSRDAVAGVLKLAKGLESGQGDALASSEWNASQGEGKESAEAREVSRLIDHALSQHATDIALQPLRTGGLKVLMRKYGEMIRPTVADTYKPDMAGRIINLLMARSGANPSSTRIREPRDGQISYQSAYGRAFLRLNFIPLNHLGSTADLVSASIRLLPTTDSVVTLASLRVSEENAEQLRFALKQTQGLILVAGPTNSGKSTTIAAALAEHVSLYGETRKRLSVEDPVERHIDGMIQINVPNHIKDEQKRFGVILPAIKRHDPDVIWVGEIRDAETANLCVAAATSGHLVFSTIHANDSVLAYDVLSKMITPDLRFQLVEAMLLSVSQRLLKRLCPACRIIDSPTASDRQFFARHLEMIGEVGELPSQIAHANPHGCAQCEHGYIGILPVNECLPFSRKVKSACNTAIGGSGNVRDFLADSRSSTLLGNAIQRVASLDVELDSIFF